jgi:hypothetical protein
MEKKFEHSLASGKYRKPNLPDIYIYYKKITFLAVELTN